MRGRIGVPLITGLLLCAASLCAVDADRVSAKRVAAQAEGASNRVTIQMRALVPGASGTLLLRVGSRQVRLSVHGLARAETIDPRAHAFLVWAVASDGRIVKLGELRINADGGSLTFNAPLALEPYSVIVTAEANALAVKPSGVPVLSTRAREVFTPQPARANDEARQGHERSASDVRTASANIAASDFYSVVDASLGNGRTLFLKGAPRWPHARGWARVGVVNGTAFVRARLMNLPKPSALGAAEYVLWARLRDGRSIYMGSLPTRGLNGSDIYVRVNNASFDRFTLFVTAETVRPALFPSTRRVLIPRERARRRMKRRLRTL